MTRILITSVMIGFCYPAMAQPVRYANAGDTARNMPVQAMNEVVVTGQYAPNSIDNAVQKVQVIDRKKMDAMGAQNLRDVLTNQLNVRLSMDPILGSSMSLQGMSGADVKILIDGVPVIGRHNGNVDISQINLNNIDHIEIIEGPMSVSYGTDALAGTLNLITKKTQAHTVSVGLSTYYETMGTYNANGRVGFSNKHHTLVLSGGRNFFSGWNTGSKPSFLDFTAHVADSSRHDDWKPRLQYMAGLQYAYTIGKTTISYSGNYFQELIINRGYPSAPYGENTFDGYYRTNRTDNTLFVNSDLSAYKHLNAFVSYNTYMNTANTYYVDLTTLEKTISNADGQQDTSKFNQLVSRATYSTSNPGKKINYELGYDINRQRASGTMMKAGYQQMGDYAAFASAEYKPVADLTIRPGIRASYNTAYTAPLIPSLNTLYKLSEHWKIRLSYARGFRAPSLQELYFYFVDINHNILGNPDLKAENSNNYNLNLGYANKVDNVSYKVDGSVFYNDIRNLITLAQVGSGAQYTYINIGKYKTKGVQGNVSVNMRHLNVSLGASYIGTYNQLSESNNIPVYNYTPELRASAYYDIAAAGIRANIFYKYTGKAIGYAVDDNNSVHQTFIDPYNIMDASLSRSLIRSVLSLTIGCKNLLNVQNIAAYAAAGAHSSSSDNIAIGTGRYYFVKLDLNINSKK